MSLWGGGGALYKCPSDMMYGWWYGLILPEHLFLFSFSVITVSDISQNLSVGT